MTVAAAAKRPKYTAGGAACSSSGASSASAPASSALGLCIADLFHPKKPAATGAEAAGVARALAPAAKLPKRKAAPVPAVAPARAAPPPPRAAPPAPRAALSPPQPAPPPQQQPAPPSAEPPALSPGQLVRISGLSQRAELNGRTATVVEWDGDHLRRYTVQLVAPFTNGEGKVVRKLKLHPGNVAASPS